MTPDEIMKKNKKQCAAEFATLGDLYNGCNAIHTHSYTIEPCKPAVPAPVPDFFNWALGPANQNQEGINPMCYNKINQPAYASANVMAVSAPVSIEGTQRDFFSDRVKQIIKKHDEALRKQFFMDAPEAPRSAKELIKAITEGNYSLNEKELEEYADGIERGYYNAFFGIRWSLDKPDHAGYKLAKEALKQAGQDIIDEGTLSPADKLLGLLKTFAGWTYKVDTKKK